MKEKVTLLIVWVLIIMSLSACAGRKYTKGITIDKPIEFRPKRLATGGDPADHPCIQGSYYHVYDTNQGMYGQREVWLCCVPVNEILSDSFNCGGMTFPASKIFGGDADYWKIRSCHLLHPTETEPTFIPVCIPAPLQAE